MENPPGKGLESRLAAIKLVAIGVGIGLCVAFAAQLTPTLAYVGVSIFAIVSGTACCFLLVQKRRQHSGFVRVVRELQTSIKKLHKVAVSAGQLAQVAKLTNNAVVIMDRQGRITWVNDGFSRLTGYELQEVIGQTPDSFLAAGKTAANELSRMQESLRLGEPIRTTLLHRGKSGAEHWLDIDLQPQFDIEGTRIAFIAIETDLTEKITEKERWQSIFGAVTEGIVLQDLTGKIIECNAAAERILGLSREQLLGRTSMDPRWHTIREDGSLLKGADHPAMVTLRTGKSVQNFVFGVEIPDGDRRWISVNTSPILDTAGKLTSVVASFADITLQRDQSQRLQLMVDGSQIGTWDWNIPTGKVIFNDHWARMLGYELTELEPHVTAWERIIDPTCLEHVWTTLQDHLESKSPEYHNEMRLRRKDGSYAWVLATGRVITRSAEGKPIRMVGIHVDISESKRLETEFKELTERYAAAVSGTSDGLWDWDCETGRVWYSERFWTLLGFSEMGPFPPGTLSEFTDRLHPDDYEPTMYAIRRNHELGADFDQEYRLRMENGDYNWFRARAATQFNELRKPIRMAGSLQNIQALKWTERSLIESREQAEKALREVHALRSALDEHSLLSVADRYGKIIDVNTGFSRISGFTPEELIGQDHRILNSGIHPKEFWKNVWRQISSGNAWRGEVCNRRKDGSLYWVDSTIVPYVGPNGEVEKYVSIRFDVTAQKAAEKALVTAQIDAEAANAAKSEFLANMSHEIRTPMTAILGFTELLAAEESLENSPQLRMDFVNTIRRNGEHLLEIINDILDISKIEAGRMSMEIVRVDPTQLVNDVVSLMQVKALAKGLTLNAVFENSIPRIIHSDPIRLRQILVNLVGNAIKFTEIGTVSMRVSCDAPNQRLKISVFDTGIGLSDEQVGRLFRAFEQADSSTTRKYGGTGLGLQISKRLAELLGGDISVCSEMGIGSTFMVEIATGPVEFQELPWSKGLEAKELLSETATEASRKTLSPQPLAGLRILLAEDGPDNQRLISHILRKAGAHVEVAENGKIAIEMLTVDGTLDGPLNNPMPFDLLLSDMQMPELDGYSTAKILRERGSTLPIIALTANAMTSDLEKCLQAGCNAYASKPIEKNSLLQLCREWGQSRDRVKLTIGASQTLS